MAHRFWKRCSVLLALSFAATACGPPPPRAKKPEPVQETAKAPEPAPRPKKKKKKCEALSEDCAATEKTKARIAKAGFTFTPVLGWKYAQGENATVAQMSDEGAAMVVSGYEAAANKKQENANRETALSAVAGEIGVTLPKKKLNWKKADDTKEVGTLKVSLWEAEGATRKEKKGILLVFFSAPEAKDSKGIIGLGFVPEDEKDAAQIGEALQTSIGSIAAVEGPAAEPPPGK